MGVVADEDAAVVDVAAAEAPAFAAPENSSPDVCRDEVS